MKNINIIIPCFNEQNNIDKLINRLDSITLSIKEYSFVYFFIDDGSDDNSYDIIKQHGKINPKIQAIKLSRNFGSHISISAGIENSKSDAVIVLPADLQEPPELISKFIDEWENGNEVVWAIRTKRAQSFLGKMFSRFFYKIFVNFSVLKNYPKEGPSAMFLLDRKVCENWNRFQESNRMIIGLISWMGFKQSKILYDQEKRIGGNSSWSFMKLLKIAIDSFVSFSFAPIRFISYLGIMISIIGFIYAGILLYNRIFLKIGPEGWTSIMIVVLILGGAQLITLGIIGEYIWRGVDESRKRPLYLISEKLNLPEDEYDS